MYRLLLTFLLALLPAGLYAAESRTLGVTTDGKRIALVVGNDSYRHISVLRNARSDARAIAEALRTAGFDVTLKYDLGDKALKEAVRGFKQRIEGGDEAVFYFSGHGVQFGAANYLLPVDIAAEEEEQVKDDALPLQRVLDDLQEQKARFSLAIVDACRNNPFKGRGKNIGGRGLAPVNPATGQMVLYSAGAGQQALDRLHDGDRDPNGLFTRILLKEMNKPGVPVDRVLRTVRDQVVRLAKNVHHEQVPALYDQAIGEFYFKPGTAQEPTVGPIGGPTVGPTTVGHPHNGGLKPAPQGYGAIPATDPVEAAYWAEVTKADDADSYATYIATYPNGMYLADANEWLERYKRQQEAQLRLKEDQAWSKAQEGNSHASYGGYLKAYPAGRYAPLAKLKQSKLQPARQPFEPETVAIPGKDYEMGKYELTQAQYQACVDDGGCKPPEWLETGSKYHIHTGSDDYYKKHVGTDRPAIGVSWDNAQSYMQWLSRKTSKTYRLPTEAEWKHACDGGSSNEYCGGNHLDAVGWYDGNSGGKTHPVGQKQANGYGLYDMTGNVWEWQQDCWEGDCSRRVLRGGSWDNYFEYSRAALRNGLTSDFRNSYVGFRVVVRSARTD
jgi:uncharacterized caspase-like protein